MTRVQHRQQVAIRWAIRGTALVMGLFVAVCAGVIPLQQARISALIDANHRRAAENASLTTIVDSAQAQYAVLFAACQQSTECLAQAPSSVLVTGPAGATGATGPGASNSQVLEQVQIYCSTNADVCRGDTGQTGAPGSPGAAGSSGQNGADSTVPGPAGPQGDPGAAGADGQPPVSWTYTDSLGFDHTCSRADPFDPASPTYSCT